MLPDLHHNRQHDVKVCNLSISWKRKSWLSVVEISMDYFPLNSQRIHRYCPPGLQCGQIGLHRILISPDIRQNDKFIFKIGFGSGSVLFRPPGYGSRKQKIMKNSHKNQPKSKEHWWKDTLFSAPNYKKDPDSYQNQTDPQHWSATWCPRGSRWRPPYPQCSPGFPTSNKPSFYAPLVIVV